MSTDVKRLEIPDIVAITPVKFGDHRGFFSETYNKTALAEIGIEIDFIQDNHSLSAEKGTMRGLHFQTPPFAQDKLVRVIRGAVFDVAVDLRRGSPTFGKHVSATLSADNWAQLLVPKGFAHGFMTLEPNTEVIYKVSDVYAPNNDAGKVLAFPTRHSVYLLAPFLSLVLIRASVQIREGMAIVLFFFALKLFLMPISHHMRSSIVRNLLAGALFFISTTTHIAGLVTVFVFLASLATLSLTSRASAAIAFVFTPLILALFFLFSFQLGLLDIGILFAEGLAGDRSAIAGDVSFEEGMVWAIFVILNILMWLTTFFVTPIQSNFQAVLPVFARNLAGPVAISGGIAVLILKTLSVSPVVIVLIVRTAEYSSALAAVLVAALYEKRYSPVVLAVFLLLKTYTQLKGAGF